MDHIYILFSNMSLKIKFDYIPQKQFISGHQKYKGIRNFWHIESINKIKAAMPPVFVTRGYLSVVFNEIKVLLYHQNIFCPASE